MSQPATEIIERIWDRWYGELRGNANSDQMCEILQEAKLSIDKALKEKRQFDSGSVAEFR